MKKKNLNKLSLNKSAVSNLDEITGAQAAPTAAPAPVKTNVYSNCAICITLRPTNCATQNNGCASSVNVWCNVSCFIC